jgi:hypothetical protein
VDPPAGRWRLGTRRPGVGGHERARPGWRSAYLVHGERHADPVLLQQHGPAGSGFPGREAGAPPQDQQGCRPGAGQGARSQRAKQPPLCAQLLASSGPPESMSRFGFGYSWLSPRLLPRRGRSSRRAVLQSQGERGREDPLETALIGSPRR